MIGNILDCKKEAIDEALKEVMAHVHNSAETEYALWSVADHFLVHDLDYDIVEMCQILERVLYAFQHGENTLPYMKNM